MIKALFLLLLITTGIYAKSYHFSEVRYSDALDKNITLHGIISFGEERLEIEYVENDSKLLYEDEELRMFDAGEEVNLDESEALQISQYFEIILLLYEGDREKIEELFSLKEEGIFTELTPKDEMGEYIKKIRLRDTKDDTLKSLQLYLSNDDNIKINIADEVH